MLLPLRLARQLPNGLGKLSAATAPASRASSHLAQAHCLTPLATKSALIVRQPCSRAYATSPTAGGASPSKPASSKPKTTTKAPKKAPKKPKKAAAKKPRKVATKKPKKAKKVLTPEAKQRAEIKKLKETALLDVPSQRKLSPYNVYVKQTYPTVQVSSPTEAFKVLHQQWTDLPAHEKSRYETLAEEQGQSDAQKRHQFLLSHTPDRIHAANVARRRLTYLSKKSRAAGTPITGLKQTYATLEDDRVDPRPASAWILFLQQKFKSGEFQGLAVADLTRAAAKQWKALGADERKAFDDAARAAREAWTAKHKAVLTLNTPRASRSPSA